MANRNVCDMFRRTTFQFSSGMQCQSRIPFPKSSLEDLFFVKLSQSCRQNVGDASQDWASSKIAMRYFDVFEMKTQVVISLALRTLLKAASNSCRERSRYQSRVF
ncbi:Hypothetical_protein [Hexamita inflata]|uniref:Hypothetical_protein n=1 Tax=Hexamita inflata TaxID=28002 RepID=A0AA86TNS9_9EUKA|nr:Hypothetical protein HINF_LOCUS9047 [Hexamita inflata]